MNNQPTPAQSDQPALVAGSTAFALDLYQRLRRREGNLFFSPYSISLALAMTYAGARAQTEQQMAAALHFDLPQDRLHPAFHALNGELAQRGQGARGKDSGGFRLNLANALWGQSGYAFLPAFLETLAANYGAGLRPLDFAAAPDSARQTINQWVSDETEGRIPDLIPPGLIDPLTRLVLTNAVYFNAAWATPFKAERTTDGPFHLHDGRAPVVPLMQQTETLPYAAGPDYQAVELPYDGRTLAMLILLPAPGEFAAFEQSFDAARLTALLARLARRRVALTLPRFRVEAQFNLKTALTALGMPAAFGDQADFRGIEPSGDLHISEVVHKAFVAVDEAGTEAAAATAVIMMTRAMMPADPVIMTIDRPFLFLIRDRQTGAVLFIGRVLDPA